MKSKTILKFLVVVALVIVAASCIETSDPVYEKTEGEELLLLKEYIDTLQSRGLDVDTTAMGVYYVVDSAGTGPYPVAGDTCVVKYQGFLLSNNYIFDTSEAHNSVDSTFTFVLETDEMISGWTDGMKVINKGARVVLIIPSRYAYGSTGNYYNIGAYETLVFVVDMVDIKQAY